MIPRFTPIIAAWVRSFAPSLDRMFLTRPFTVSSVMESSEAICLLAFPAAINRSTSTSPGVAQPGRAGQQRSQQEQQKGQQHGGQPQQRRQTRAGSWRRAHSAARAASDEDSARETTATATAAAGRAATDLSGSGRSSASTACSRARRSLGGTRHREERSSLPSGSSLGAWRFHWSDWATAHLAAPRRQSRALRRGRILFSGGAIRLRRVQRLAVG
jgi:hypothetical protein